MQMLISRMGEEKYKWGNVGKRVKKIKIKNINNNEYQHKGAG